MSKVKFIACGALIFITGLYFGAMIGTFSCDGIYHGDAVKNGCGRYHPVSGKFEWIRGYNK